MRGHFKENLLYILAIVVAEAKGIGYTEASQLLFVK
ncbi:MAG: hypothetical protein CMIDDMOC_00512 [Sodalis sp. Fle]|nr:MAG: hypothetical protein CMIDDMOC_00512 [Sodalis sp. Fle]